MESWFGRRGWTENISDGLINRQRPSENGILDEC